MTAPDDRFVPYGRGESQEIYASPNCRLRLDEVTYPDGSTGTYSVLDVPHAVTVVPMLANGDIVLIRQWRYTLEKAHLELPAGRIHAGESLEDAARRELREETGYLAEKLEALPAFHPLMGLSPHRAHPFIATGLHDSGLQELEAPEQIIVETYSREEVMALLERGEITDVFACVPLMHVLLFKPSGQVAG